MSVWSRHSGYQLEPVRQSEVHRDRKEREREGEGGESPRQQTQWQMALLEDERAVEVVEVLGGGEVRREGEE